MYMVCTNATKLYEMKPVYSCSHIHVLMCGRANETNELNQIRALGYGQPEHDKGLKSVGTLASHIKKRKEMMDAQ